MCIAVKHIKGMFTQAVFFSGASGCFTLYSYDTERFCKKIIIILDAFKNTAASGFFSLLWVVFKLGNVQLAKKKHPTSGSFLTADQ